MEVFLCVIHINFHSSEQLLVDCCNEIKLKFHLFDCCNEIKLKFHLLSCKISQG